MECIAGFSNSDVSGRLLIRDYVFSTESFPFCSRNSIEVDFLKKTYCNLPNGLALF